MKILVLILSLAFSVPSFAGKPQCRDLFAKEIIYDGFLESIRGINFPEIDLLRAEGDYSKPQFLKTSDGTTAFIMNYSDHSRLVEIGALGTTPKITRFNRVFAEADKALTRDRKIVQLHSEYHSTSLSIYNADSGRLIKREAIPRPQNGKSLFRYLDANFSVYATGLHSLKILNHESLKAITINTRFNFSKVTVNPEGYLAVLSKPKKNGRTSAVIYEASTGKEITRYNFNFKAISVDAVLQQGRKLILRRATRDRDRQILEIYEDQNHKPIQSMNLNEESKWGLLNGGKTFYYSHSYSNANNQKLLIYSPDNKDRGFTKFSMADGEIPKVASDQYSLLFRTNDGFKIFDAISGQIYFFRYSRQIKSDNIDDYLGFNRRQNKFAIVTHNEDITGDGDGVTRIVEVTPENKVVQIHTEIEEMLPEYVSGDNNVQIVANERNLIAYSPQVLGSLAATPETKDFLARLSQHFESEAYLNQPETTLRFILQLGQLSPISVEEIFNKYPMLFSTIGKLDTLTFKSRADEINLRMQMDMLLKNFNFRDLAPKEIAQLIRPLLGTIDPEKLSVAITRFANLILRKTESSLAPEIALVPSYNRFKLIKEEIKRQLGLPWKAMTDVAVAYDKHLDAKVVVFGSYPIDHSTPNKFGFHSVVKSEFNIDRNRSVAISWQHGDNRVRATVETRPLATKNIRPPRNDSPDYDAMIEDKILGGAIVIPPNIDDAEGFGSQLARNYKSFYKTQGYSFQNESLTGAQASKLLLEKVESGEIDYLVREGHSEAQTDSLVSLGGQVSIAIGRKTRGGVEERIYILGPEDNLTLPTNNGTISFSELGRYLRARSHSSDFIFLQTACFSKDDLGRYVGMTAARGFTPLATDEGADTFVNERSSPIRKILVGILGRKPWSQMRSENSSGEDYVFPDQPEYTLQGLNNRSKVAEVRIHRDYDVIIEAKDKN
ncbi:MAG: hypothetical protein A4S09_05580 [Proteobacteria bacterium SG_bin7]|nr:MAG: hypothetical protein A4S09_05580 [Proteobacteria bacterium SG_bin7]